MGCVSLERWKDHGLAELGYWFGVPHWGRGCCTEAAAAVVDFGFQVLGVRKAHSCCMTVNPASRRVLVKLGFRSEGVRRAHVLKWGEPREVENFGLLREEWRPGPASEVRVP